MHEYILSTIFMSVKMMPANLANIVIISSVNAIRTSLVKNHCIPFIQTSSATSKKKKNKPKRTTKNLVSGAILEQGFFNEKKRRETRKKP